MFSYAHDADANAVVLLSGTTLEDADLDAYMAAVAELARVAPPSGSAVIFIIDDGTPLPPASWRRAMAKATLDLTKRPIRALVGSSPFVKSIAAGVAWLRPESPYEDEVVVPTLDEAIAWVEARRGPRRAIFERLLAEARAKLG